MVNVMAIQIQYVAYGREHTCYARPDVTLERAQKTLLSICETSKIEQFKTAMYNSKTVEEHSFCNLEKFVERLNDYSNGI